MLDELITMAEKGQEKHYLNIFRQLYKEFPPGIVEHDDNPDFLVKSPSQIIGIEITRLFRKGPHITKSQEEERRIITETACKKCEEMSITPVLVAIFFNNNIVLKKSRRDEIVSQLVELISNHLPKENEPLSLENKFESTINIPKEIDKIKINRSSLITEHDWSVLEVGFASENFTNDLQKIINEKNDKLKNYLKKCNLCWLLIVAEGYAPSSNFSSSPIVLKNRYISSFKRIFFLEVFSKKVSELNLESAQNAGSGL